MKNLLLMLCCLSMYAAKAQNGFTTYTTNLAITGGFKSQTAFLVDNLGSWLLNNFKLVLSKVFYARK